MANKNFPISVSQMARAPGVKRAYISDNPPTHPDDCENCGGTGVFVLFLATKGPFQTPAGPYSKAGTVLETNRYDERSGSWWVGTSQSLTCPVCKGVVVAKNALYAPASRDVADEISKVTQGLKVSQHRLPPPIRG